jgi:2-oxo-4-hydroxy-4-carboxy--5-ureidoimidazoline (OHCU) decarboxylase
MTMAQVNDCNRDQFVETVGRAFERSLWVAERAWRKRPFASFDDLSTRLIREVQTASPDEQLAFLRAHDGLPGDDEYRKKFGFPFLYGVRDSDASTQMESLKRRLKSPHEQEFQVALGHAFRIARFRLEDMIS